MDLLNFASVSKVGSSSLMLKQNALRHNLFVIIKKTGPHPHSLSNSIVITLHEWAKTNERACSQVHQKGFCKAV